jgi:lipopolysaccharide biosynthesis protein
MLSMSDKAKARVIAFYLPQFHPIPENDEWWGEGFTEWTNVTKAKPLFRGHYQPQLPSDLGFYDLRVPQIREAQAALAREHGIEGFCYWHYWFAGDRLLERPFQEVLESGRPNFPFCLGWANHTWSGLWSGGDEKRILKEQVYPGKEDQKRHFDFLLTAFRDSRYLRVEGKPLVVIYKPLLILDCRATLDYWRELARQAGLPGLHLVATLEYHERHWDAKGQGFDAITVWPLGRVFQSARPYLWSTRVKQLIKRKGFDRLHGFAEALWPGREWIYDHENIRPMLICEDSSDLAYHPMAIPNWDTTARYGRQAIVFHNSTPESFRLHFREVLGQVKNQPVDQRIIFVKSWNEWAEGNYLEPDQRFGRGYLEALRDELIPAASNPRAERSSSGL